MSVFKPSRAVMAAAITAALLAGGAALPSDALAATPKAQAASAKYPAAKRTEPKETKTTAANNKKVNDIVKFYADDSKRAEVMADADAILADPKANAYEKSFVTQIAGLLSNKAGDNAKAIQYFKTGLSINGLPNEQHFDLMHNLAIVQTQAKDNAGAIATLKQFFEESGSTGADARALLAQNYYESGDYAQAATLIKQAIDSSAEPKEQWRQMYMLAMNKGGNSAGALAEAKAIADSKPNDKVAQTNYAALLQEAGKSAESVAVLNSMRSRGLLTTDTDYRNLFLALAPVEGTEKQVIEIVNEGLQKKILTPDYDVYAALAQSYYWTGEEGKAIEFYEKAGPLAKTGSTYLNLARLYWQQGQNMKAKEVAEKAKAKGLSEKDLKTYNQIKALPDKGGSQVIIERKK